jgi:hypothetical protein
VDHALAGPVDARTPSELHPIFYGSYDWHSCVHSHWMLARLLRRFPDFAPAADICALFDTQFVPDKVAAERAYFTRPTARGFKRPYGWGWLLKLAAELALHSDDRWGRNLAPLAEIIAQRFREFLPLSTYPVHNGRHVGSSGEYARETVGTDGSGLDRVIRYLDVARDGLKGCRMGRFACESSIAEASLRKPVERYFRELQQLLEAALREAQADGEIAKRIDASELALMLITVVQGGFVVSRVYRDRNAINRATEMARILLKSLRTR